jgi:choline dehydrogenase-like flavoprotein
LINLLCIAEDMPEPSNKAYVDTTRRDKFGVPALRVYHRYCGRDLAARSALYAQAKRVLRTAGALPIYCYHLNSFSHAIGTCRLGSSQKSSVVDPECRVWATKNIYIVDGSVMRTGGSVNPSLTIAANSLRVASLLAEN